MQWISNVRKWFAKRPCNKLGSVQFLLIERTHCMADSGFPIAGVSRVSINYCKCIQGGCVYPSVSSESRHRRPNCPKSEDNWSRLIFTPLAALLLLSATFSQSWSSWTDGDYVTVMPWRAFGPIWKVYSTHWGVIVLPNSFIIIIVIVIIIVKHFLFIRILSLLSSSSWSVGAPVFSATHYRLPWFGNLRFPENPDFLVYLNLNLSMLPPHIWVRLIITVLRNPFPPPMYHCNALDWCIVVTTLIVPIQLVKKKSFIN